MNNFISLSYTMKWFAYPSYEIWSPLYCIMSLCKSYFKYVCVCVRGVLELQWFVFLFWFLSLTLSSVSFSVHVSECICQGKKSFFNIDKILFSEWNPYPCTCTYFDIQFVLLVLCCSKRKMCLIITNSLFIQIFVRCFSVFSSIVLS